MFFNFVRFSGPFGFNNLHDRNDIPIKVQHWFLNPLLKTYSMFPKSNVWTRIQPTKENCCLIYHIYLWIIMDYTLLWGHISVAERDQLYSSIKRQNLIHNLSDPLSKSSDAWCLVKFFMRLWCYFTILISSSLTNLFWFNQTKPNIIFHCILFVFKRNINLVHKIYYYNGSLFSTS